MTAPRLLVIRHGRTEWNATGRFQGQTDIALDSLGLSQAAAVAASLVGLEVAALVSSDLARAVDTAAPIAEALGVAPTVDKRLREISLGEWEGLDSPAAWEAFPAEYVDWHAGLDIRRGGGENYADVAARASAWVASAVATYPTGLIVAVTHGGTARSLTGSLMGLPVSSWSALGPMGNCRLTVLGQEEARWRLLAWNAGAASGLSLPGLTSSLASNSAFR